MGDNFYGLGLRCPYGQRRRRLEATLYGCQARVPTIATTDTVGASMGGITRDGTLDGVSRTSIGCARHAALTGDMPLRLVPHVPKASLQTHAKTAAAHTHFEWVLA